jgi:hypothetical protein
VWSAFAALLFSRTVAEWQLAAPVRQCIDRSTLGDNFTRFSFGCQ